MTGGPQFRERLLGFLQARAPRPSGDLFPRLEAIALSGLGAGLSLADRRARFAAALARVGGEVHDLAGVPDPRRALLVVFRSLLPGAGAEASPRAALDGDPAWALLAARGLPVAVLAREAGFEPAKLAEDGGGDVVDALSRAALGVTVADLAVAETGSVVQFSRPWRPRSISLLPPAHLVLVPENRIVPGLEDLLEAAAAELDGPAGFLSLITGPSRTADIEKVLTIGVHGPGRLVAAVVGGIVG